MQRGQHLQRRPFAHLQAAAQRLKFFVQIVQGFTHELEVLQGGIGLRPQTGLDDVEAQHRAKGCRVRQCGMVMQPQVAFEPDDAVSQNHAP